MGECALDSKFPSTFHIDHVYKHRLIIKEIPPYTQKKKKDINELEISSCSLTFKEG